MSVDAASPEQEAAEEAAWALETAETLLGRGDLDGARTWFLRAADHLMDAGDDDRALEVAKRAANVAETQASASQQIAALAAEAAPGAPFPPASSIAPPPAEPAPSPFPPASSISPPPAEPAPTAPPAVLPSSTGTLPPPVTIVTQAPASERPSARPSAPPREALVWRADRAGEAEKLWARLLALPLFQDLPQDRLRALSRHVTVLRRPVDAKLLAAAPYGAPAVDTPLLVLTDGAVSLRAGDARLPIHLGAGDTLGEVGAYFGGPSVVDAVADADVTAVSFAPSLVRALAREFEGFRTALDECAWERAFATLGHAAPLLRYLAPAARAQVFSRFEPVLLREGEVLIAEDAPPQWVWLVAAGEVEVYGGALDPLSVWRARAGDALGVEASVGDGPSGVSARALRAVLAARLPSAAFREVIAAHPELRASLDVIGVAGHGIIC